MDDMDGYEDIYDSTDKHAEYHPALKDDDVEGELRKAALEDCRSSVGGSSGSSYCLPGCVPAQRSDDIFPDTSKWHPPPMPRGYRGVHRFAGTRRTEATQGSAEHRALAEFLGKHGDKRLLDPGQRAVLFGEKGRGFAESRSHADPQKSANVVVLDAEETVDLEAVEDSKAKKDMEAAQDASKPLWKGWLNVTSDQKEALLKGLGRNFLVGEEQDMDGKSARHSPFKSDPAKQRRYVQFCLALEGRTSAAEALQDTGGLTADAREAELQEFGRVYRAFKQENPTADIAAEMELGKELAEAAVKRRTISIWVPDKLLCKRWGVPVPKLLPPTEDGELPSAKRQRQYNEKVQAGLAKVTQAGWDKSPSSGAGSAAASAVGQVAGTAGLGVAAATAGAAGTVAAGVPTAAFSPPVGESAGAPPRPPDSLFASIFGDESSGDET
eukprot:TRINITY_DN51717_c0_g2_i2.p1 TRINITY_DN51717_c0_g2~~TRINITY_DN51717_c0_g2_i2.p1  ORF type:complete len:440 (-),score=127.03 TRINITY_DN51717_c0_g2_i2:52-1371(-)